MKDIIDQAIKITNDFYKYEGLEQESYERLYTRALDWYIGYKTKIKTPLELSALVISGNYKPGLTTQEIDDLVTFYFFII